MCVCVHVLLMRHEETTHTAHADGFCSHFGSRIRGRSVSTFVAFNSAASWPKHVATGFPLGAVARDAVRQTRRRQPTRGGRSRARGSRRALPSSWRPPMPFGEEESHWHWSRCGARLRSQGGTTPAASGARHQAAAPLLAWRHPQSAKGRNHGLGEAAPMKAAASRK